MISQEEILNVLDKPMTCAEIGKLLSYKGGSLVLMLSRMVKLGVIQKSYKQVGVKLLGVYTKPTIL